MKNLTKVSLLLILIMTTCVFTSYAGTNHSDSLKGNNITKPSTTLSVASIRICVNGICIEVIIESDSFKDSTIKAISKLNRKGSKIIYSNFPKELDGAIVYVKRQQFSGMTTDTGKTYIVPGKYQIKNGSLKINVTHKKREAK